MQILVQSSASAGVGINGSSRAIPTDTEEHESASPPLSLTWNTGKKTLGTSPKAGEKRFYCPHLPSLCSVDAHKVRTHRRLKQARMQRERRCHISW